MTRFNHAFDITFSLESADPTGIGLTGMELLAALEARVAEFRNDPVMLIEAAGMPFDSYVVDDVSHQPA